MADAILPDKTCRKCGALFSGVRCNECVKAYNAAHRKVNGEYKEYYAAYYKAHAEKYRDAAKARNALDPSRKKASDKAWREANVERKRAASAAYYAANIDRAKALMAERRKNNPNEARDRTRRWVLDNPEKTRVHQINRRALKRNNGGKLSSDIASRLMVLQQGKCACCRTDLRKSKYHLDHIEPLAKGGMHDDSNIQLLCPQCNMTKHTSDPVKFMQSRGFLI